MFKFAFLHLMDYRWDTVADLFDAYLLFQAYDNE